MSSSEYTDSSGSESDDYSSGSDFNDEDFMIEEDQIESKHGQQSYSDSSLYKPINKDLPIKVKNRLRRVLGINLDTVEQDFIDNSLVTDQSPFDVQGMVGAQPLIQR